MFRVLCRQSSERRESSRQVWSGAFNISAKLFSFWSLCPSQWFPPNLGSLPSVEFSALSRKPSRGPQCLGCLLEPEKLSRALASGSVVLPSGKGLSLETKVFGSTLPNSIPNRSSVYGACWGTSTLPALIQRHGMAPEWVCLPLFIAGNPVNMI